MLELHFFKIRNNFSLNLTESMSILLKSLFLCVCFSIEVVATYHLEAILFDLFPVRMRFTSQPLTSVMKLEIV